MSTRLEHDEVQRLLQATVPAHLATIEGSGFPRVTPIWFLWRDGAFLMTSLPSRPHVRNLARDRRASVCVDIERVLPSGERPNRQVKAFGEADVSPDRGGSLTRLITLKYVRGDRAQSEADRRAAMERVVIRLVPHELVGVGAGGPFDATEA